MSAIAKSSLPQAAAPGKGEVKKQENKKEGDRPALKAERPIVNLYDLLISDSSPEKLGSKNNQLTAMLVTCVEKLERQDFNMELTPLVRPYLAEVALHFGARRSYDRRDFQGRLFDLNAKLNERPSALPAARPHIQIEEKKVEPKERDNPDELIPIKLSDGEVAIPRRVAASIPVAAEILEYWDKKEAIPLPAILKKDFEASLGLRATITEDDIFAAYVAANNMGDAMRARSRANELVNLIRPENALKIAGMAFSISGHSGLYFQCKVILKCAGQPEIRELLKEHWPKIAKMLIKLKTHSEMQVEMKSDTFNHLVGALKRDPLPGNMNKDQVQHLYALASCLGADTQKRCMHEIMNIISFKARVDDDRLTSVSQAADLFKSEDDTTQVFRARLSRYQNNDVARRNEDVRSAFSSRDSRALEGALLKGGDPNSVMRELVTRGVDQINLPVLKVLVDYGFRELDWLLNRINDKMIFGLNAIPEFLKCVTCLLENGANPDAPMTSDGYKMMRPIGKAVGHLNFSVVRELLRYGAKDLLEEEMPRGFPVDDPVAVLEDIHKCVCPGAGVPQDPAEALQQWVEATAKQVSARQNPVELKDFKISVKAAYWVMACLAGTLESSGLDQLLAPTIAAFNKISATIHHG